MNLIKDLFEHSNYEDWQPILEKNYSNHGEGNGKPFHNPKNNHSNTQLTDKQNCKELWQTKFYKRYGIFTSIYFLT